MISCQEEDNSFLDSYNDIFKRSLDEKSENYYNLKFLTNVLIPEDDEQNMSQYNYTNANYIIDYINTKEDKEQNDKKEYDNNSFLGKKRKLKQNIFLFKKYKKIKTISDEINIKNSNIKNEETKINKKGRKTIKDETERIHNNESDDNMIRKIKVHLFKYARDIINQNFEDKSKKILKLDYSSIMCLKRSVNLDLFNKTLKQIFSEERQSDKYKNYNDNENEILIKNICTGIIKEEKVKKILNLKFLELLEIFRRKIGGNKKKSNVIEKKLERVNLLVNNKYEGYERFINNLMNKKSVSQNYIFKIKHMILDYESWFINKEGRD